MSPRAAGTANADRDLGRERGQDPDRTRDADRTRAEILRVATEIFARDGYSGARVDEIAAATRTTKRMLYYYFGDKAGLYTAVLEGAYLGIREAERALSLDGLPPVDALVRLIEFGFDYHAGHPELGRLVAVENIHHAEHLSRSTRQAALNSSILDLLDTILDRGMAEGVFHRRVPAIDLHLMVMALALFPVTNAPSIQASFAFDMTDPGIRARLRGNAVEAILAWVGAERGPASVAAGS